MMMKELIPEGQISTSNGMGTMIDWNTRFQALPDAEKDKIALLRVIECSNGIIQYKFRDEDEDALSVEETRDAMKFSMGCMKK
jgi:hypothetical protein